jgi:hypothetical protein
MSRTAVAAIAVAALVFTPGTAHADVFEICPDGREGVVGGHTSCDFAANVRQVYFGSGQPDHFPAYSPVTGDRYEMDCESGYSARFNDGTVRDSIRCYAGTNAEVVIW